MLKAVKRGNVQWPTKFKAKIIDINMDRVSFLSIGYGVSNRHTITKKFKTKHYILIHKEVFA